MLGLSNVEEGGREAELPSLKPPVVPAAVKVLGHSYESPSLVPPCLSVSPPLDRAGHCIGNCLRRPSHDRRSCGGKEMRAT